MLLCEKTRGDITLRIQGIPMGRDLLVAVTGGTRPHLGAAGLGITRPSLSDPEKNGASVSVLTLTGHKDDEIARFAADFLTRALGVNVLVGCGIHLDGITPEKIEDVRLLTKELLSEFIKQTEKRKPDACD